MKPYRSDQSKGVQRLVDGTVRLDDVDHELLNILAAEARIPNNELAARVGIAPSTCSLRVRRLVSLGAITGYHAAIAPEALGLPIQALVALRVQPSARTRIGELTAKLAVLPGVVNVYFLAGSVDFLVHVAAASTDDLRTFVTSHLSASRDFASTETSLIFDHVRGGSHDRH